MALNRNAEIRIDRISKKYNVWFFEMGDDGEVAFMTDYDYESLDEALSKIKYWMTGGDPDGLN